VTGTAWLTPAVTKEIRALFPAWIACMLTIVAALVVRDSAVRGLGVFAYGLGSLLLGVQAIGHEYSHRTLPVLLAQPIGRRRLLVTKLAVLAAMLAGLGAAAWFVLGDDRAVLDPFWRDPSVLGLVTLCALFGAPWLTMMCRGALPAAVFTIALPAAMLILGDLTAALADRFMGGVDFDRVKLAVFWWGVIAFCAVGAFSGWRTFMGLQVIEGRDSELSMPDWTRDGETPDDQSASASPRRRHPIWLLIKKELHLQQLTFVIVAIYLVFWGSLSLAVWVSPDVPRYVIAPLTALYCALLSLLIGALASAEERQFGTLEWQVLMPMPMWKQWTVKAGVTLGLAMLLGIGLPVVLMLIDRSGGDPRNVARMLREFPLIVLLLTASTLYVSSLCASGVRALVLSLPAIAGAFLFFQAGLWVVEQLVVRTFFVRLVSTSFESYRTTRSTVMAILILAFVAALLRYAAINHRSGERGVAPVLKQAASIAGLLIVGVLALGGVTIYYFGS
jgi:hypothetical protein